MFFRILKGIHGRATSAEELAKTGQRYVNLTKGDLIEKDPSAEDTIADVRSGRLEPVSDGGPLLSEQTSEPAVPAASKKTRVK